MSFCVKCGVDCEDTLNGLCVDCFLINRTLSTMPHHVDLERCTNCLEFKAGERWLKKDTQKAVEDAAIDNMTVIKEAKPVEVGALVQQQDPQTYMVTVESLLDIGGLIVEDSNSVLVRVRNVVCKRCSRLLGNYYESILQIRNGEKTLPDSMKDATLAHVEQYVDQVSAHNRSIFITKMELVTGGVDVYLSSISLGKALAKELSESFCAETKESSKLVGKKDGQDIYRVTYLIRLPDFQVGDVVAYENKYYKMVRITSAGGKLTNLTDLKDRTVRRVDMSNVKLYRKQAEFGEATVISRSETEIQIMHPTNYSIIDLRIPEGEEIGDTVRTVNIDDVLYYVPM